MAGAVHVSGLRELNQAFAKIERTVAFELRFELKKVAEPVRQRAEHLAFSRIRNIGGVWGRMRSGDTMRAVYVAPATRRSRGSPRPKFGPLLLDKAMVPALEETREGVFSDLEAWVDRVTRSAGF